MVQVAAGGALLVAETLPWLCQALVAGLGCESCVETFGCEGRSRNRAL